MDTGERCTLAFPPKSRAMLACSEGESACNRVLERRRQWGWYPDSPKMVQERANVGFAMKTRVTVGDARAVQPNAAVGTGLLVGEFAELWVVKWRGLSHTV